MARTMISRWTVLALGACAVVWAGCIPRGAGGAGGAVAGANAESTPEGKACPAEGVIDDGEDSNNQIAAVKGRAGYWYTFVDKAGSSITPQAGEQGGTFSMAPGGANGSQSAAHMTGKLGGSGTIFAGMGFNFLDPKAPYDATAYKGVSFWARRSENSTGTVRLKVPDMSTDPEGKVCTECFNDFGADIELTPSWTKYVIPFSSLRQQSGWGAPHPAAVDPSKVYGLQWQVNSPGADYDIWIDDVQFTGCP